MTMHLPNQRARASIRRFVLQPNCDAATLYAGLRPTGRLTPFTRPDLPAASGSGSGGRHPAGGNWVLANASPDGDMGYPVLFNNSAAAFFGAPGVGTADQYPWALPHIDGFSPDSWARSGHAEAQEEAGARQCALFTVRAPLCFVGTGWAPASGAPRPETRA